jgi:hypothetical protein
MSIPWLKMWMSDDAKDNNFDREFGRLYGPRMRISTLPLQRQAEIDECKGYTPYSTMRGVNLCDAKAMCGAGRNE